METELIPAIKERLPVEELESAKSLFSEKNIFTQVLDASPTCILVLNKYRQVVYYNKAVKKLVNNSDGELLYGKRPGELFNCQCAYLTPFGCGTSEFCETCGALKVIVSALNGIQDVQECRIIQKDSKDALDLRVWADHLNINGEAFSIFSFIDISHEKRRFALERIFFHDLLNSASSLISCTNLLKYSTKEEHDEVIPLVSELAFKLVEEIKAQRDLSRAENSELPVNPAGCDSMQIIDDIIKSYKRLFELDDKIIELDKGSVPVNFVSDSLLISRVLGNMVKNAMESTSRNTVTKIGCKETSNGVLFYVNNPGFIPRPIRNQIFQRSFTTKGLGRGLGTYSMKLITEKYLKGKISFTSSENEGTTFYAEYPMEISEDKING